MRVILRKDVEKLGESGSLQNVADGYARNYLIPKGFAILATPGEMKTYENNLHAKEMKIGRQEQQLQSFADKIGSIALQFEANAGEQGRLFGSITAGDIAEQLSAKVGQEIDRRKIILDEPIRHTGEYTVHVHVVGKLKPAVKVSVTATESSEVAVTEPDTDATAEAVADVIAEVLEAADSPE